MTAAARGFACCSRAAFWAKDGRELVDDVADDCARDARERLVGLEFFDTTFKFTYASLS